MKNWKERFLVFGIGILLAVSMGLCGRMTMWAQAKGNEVMGSEKEHVEVSEEGWREKAAARGIYDFSVGRWMIGTHYLGETLEEIRLMQSDPTLPQFSLETFFEHTVFSGVTEEDLLFLEEEGVSSLEEYLEVMPQTWIGEKSPTLKVKNYTTGAGTSEAFRIQSYPLNGSYAVCVKRGASVVSGTKYTLFATSTEEGGFSSSAVTEVLGYSAKSQKIANQVMTLVNNPDREAAFPGLPEYYWVFFVQAGSWLVLEPDSSEACVASEDYFLRKMADTLGWADNVNSDVNFVVNGVNWASESAIRQIWTWLKNWIQANGYCTLYWYHVPGTAYQQLCVPDIQKRTLDQGWIELTKRGTNTGSAAALEGVVYGVYKEAACRELVTTISLDRNGYGISNAVGAGEYYVKERTAVSGVCLNETVYPVTVSSGTVTNLNAVYAVEDAEWQGRISIRKLDSLNGAVLSGAVFALETYSVTTGQYAQTGILTEENGLYQSGMLYYTADNQGRFRVSEVQAPSGYGMSGWSQDVVLTKKEEIFMYEVTNEPTWYRFVKVDHKGQPLVGCRFRLLDMKGQTIDEWVTDETGTHDLVGALCPGQSYQLREIEVPAGYKKAPDQVINVDRVGVMVVITTENEPIPARITVHKMDQKGYVMEGAKFVLYTTCPLPEAETYSHKGVVYYRYGEAETDEEGDAIFEGVDVVTKPRYLVVEVATAPGHVLLADPIEIGEIPLGKEEEIEVEVVIVNGGIYELPNSGEPGWNARRIAWGAACAAAIMSMMIERRRQRLEKGGC